MAKKTGFTIIELSVVLAVIAVIAAAALIILSPSSAKGRDARREADIKTIQSALNLYINQKGNYPVCPELSAINGSNDCLSAALLYEGTVQGVPTDPRYNGAGVCGEGNAFLYCYQSSDGFSYVLNYRLETDSVPQKSAGWQNVNP